MAISVLNVREIRNGSNFPLNNYEESFGPLEESIYLPLEALKQNSKGGLAKTVFFSFKRLNDILTNGEKEISRGMQMRDSENKNPSDTSKQIINSRIISASLATGKHIELPPNDPVRISLKHLREQNMKNPVCVFWDWELSAWSDAGCWVADTNMSRTLCECSHLTNFALLMEEDGDLMDANLPAFHLEIIISAVVLLFFLAAVIILLKVI